MIDSRTIKTPFSGGVDILVNGKMKGSSALLVAVACLTTAAVIGAYFLAQFFLTLLPIAVYGALAIVLYTPVLSKIHGISEVVAGSGFGVMGLGTYVTQTGVIDLVGIAVFVPISILVGLLLFLNEFPDADVDRIGGRRHLVILMGKRRAAVLYVAATAVTYLSIIYAVLAGILPLPVIVAFFTVPIAFKACRLVLQEYGDIQKLVPALGLNVIMILVTILLIGVGFVFALLI
jgi:1,4-dihydroxy-2-naphthoate octaprenyltransferase